MAAQNKINVQSNSIESNQNAVWAAGLEKDGKLSNADATLTIDAQNAQIAGKVLSGDQINIKAAQTTDLSQSESQAKKINIATTQLNTSNAKIIADGSTDYKKKLQREQSTQFVDIAAFYGLFVPNLLNHNSISMPNQWCHVPCYTFSLFLHLSIFLLQV